MICRVCSYVVSGPENLRGKKGLFNYLKISDIIAGCKIKKSIFVTEDSSETLSKHRFRENCSFCPTKYKCFSRSFLTFKASAFVIPNHLIWSAQGK